MLVNNTSKLEHRLSELTLRSDGVAIGRAAWGIFALLSIWKEARKSQKIALPSFVCQSVLASTLLAGWEPEFCDIDLKTGNVSDTEWKRVIDLGVHAVLFVHLFGTVGNAGQIADICRMKGIYFIEDAAQSFGGSWEGLPCGSFGDASIISFGQTKLIDSGHGGMVLTNESKLAKALRSFNNSYSIPILDLPAISKEFREMFYSARRKLGSDSVFAKKCFNGLIKLYEPLIISKWKPEVSDEILAKLSNLDSLVRERRDNYAIYKDKFRNTALVPLTMSPGSVPWRAVFRLPDIDWAEQEALSEALRKEGLDLSNWYIPSHWLMEQTSLLENKLDFTECLSKEIFQLWVAEGINKEKLKYTASVFILKLKELVYA